MEKLAFLFPGQGSQRVGMGSDLHAGYPASRDVFREADERLGFPLSRLCFDGPEKELTLTANAQPAILVASIAAWRLVEAEGIRPDFVAGHSLGEYSALVAADCIDLADAVFAVRLRGRLMQEATPVGAGGMVAILGLDAEAIAAICREAAEGEVLETANFNCPGQIVVAGHTAAVERAVGLASRRGAKRAIRLQVSAPFHSSLMIPAKEGMKEALAAIEFRDLAVPLINNADASVIESGKAARSGLIRQITSPVRWEESLRVMIEFGVNTFVEIGPGKVLTGLLRRVDRTVRSFNIEDGESLRSALAELRG